MKRMRIHTYSWNMSGSTLYLRSKKCRSTVMRIEMQYNELAKASGWPYPRISGNMSDVLVTIFFDYPTDDHGDSHGYFSGPIQRHLKEILATLPGLKMVPELPYVGYFHVMLEKPYNKNISEFFSYTYFRIIELITASQHTGTPPREILQIWPHTSQSHFVRRDNAWFSFGEDEHSVHLKKYLSKRQ